MFDIVDNELKAHLWFYQNPAPSHGNLLVQCTFPIHFKIVLNADCEVMTRVWTKCTRYPEGRSLAGIRSCQFIPSSIKSTRLKASINRTPYKTQAYAKVSRRLLELHWKSDLMPPIWGRKTSPGKSCTRLCKTRSRPACFLLLHIIIITITCRKSTTCFHSPRDYFFFSLIFRSLSRS